MNVEGVKESPGEEGAGDCGLVFCVEKTGRDEKRSPAIGLEGNVLPLLLPPLLEWKIFRVMMSYRAEAIL